jgi:alginate O-acetyltransferase complex protein AlgI
MLFNSHAFLLGFLPAAIAICAVADRFPAARIWTLVLLSIIFYGYWNPLFVPLLVGSILANWLAIRASSNGKRRAVLTAAIVANLGVLAFFKYTNFVLDNVAAIAGRPLAQLNIELPLAISFFTFHHIMYLVDLRRGRAGVYPLDKYALYICFFPQLIAGPLARWSQVMHQFGREMLAPGWERRCAIGVTFIVFGLIEKVFIGDELASLLGPIYANAKAGPLTDGSAWLALGFGFQVFFDFAGYCDIAIGVALILGVELPQNFNAPFKATSIQDFWQRWHITLALFLRDYVFLPLCDVRIAGRRHIFAAMVVTMMLCGLWHGAGWNFVLWGTLHGLALALATAWPRFAPSPPAVVSRVATVAFVLVTAVVFGAETLQQAGNVLQD